MGSVEEVLAKFGENMDGLLAMNEEAWQVYSYYLMHVSPKPATAGWGWSRVGWSWASWWQFVEKCISTLEPLKAFDVIALLLRLIQDKEEGEPLAQLKVWVEQDRLQRVLTKLGELGSCEREEVVEKLMMQGVVAE